MNLILASIDKSILDTSSAVRARVRAYAELCEHLDVIVIAPSSQKLLVIEEANLRIVPITSSNKVLAAILLLKMLCGTVKLRGRQNTLISSQDPFLLGFICNLAAWLSRVPLHVQVHIDFFSPYFKKESQRQWIEAVVAPWVLSRAIRVRVVSRKIADYCITLGIEKEAIDVIPIAFSTSVQADTAPEVFADVLVAARFVRQKNIPLAIAAFAIVAQKHKSITLGIVGNGSEELHIKSYASDLIKTHPELQGRIRFMPWTNNLTALMKGARVFALSSDYEGWGMTVVESCSVGTPVVMTDVGCAREFAIDGYNSRIVGVRDVESFAQALEEVLFSPGLHEHLAQGARASVATIPSVSEYTQAIVSSWKTVLAEVRI